ncbi:hypothetical protein AMTRI_Chr11g155670 [Amborella trichopoda]
MAGRSTLIKASLANTPIYFMLLFQISASVSKRIELMRNIIWSGSVETKKIHLVSWNKIYTHKKKGGLGIRDLRKQNWALLGKWWCRIANHENQLSTQVIRSKYNISPQMWLLETYSTGLGIWKTLVSILPRFRTNIRFLARGGNKVRFWEDLLIGLSPLRDRLPSLFAIPNCKESMIVDEMTPSGKCRTWNPSFRRSLSDEELRQFATFSSELHGVFLPQTYDKRLKVGPLTIDNLQKRGFQFPNGCIMCLNEDETISHLLLHCDFAYSVWSLLIQLFRLSWVLPPSVQAMLTQTYEDGFRKSGKILWKASVAATLWHIWGERTRGYFEELRIHSKPHSKK